MEKFASGLKVMFFQGNNPVLKREDFQYSKLSDDSSLYLDLDSPKDRAILDILMKTDTICLDGFVYKVLSREFIIDGTGLFIMVKKVE